MKLVPLQGELKISLTSDAFLAVLRSLLEAAPVDETWYRETYRDVVEAIESGTYRDAKHHFSANGYLEGGAPSR